MQINEIREYCESISPDLFKFLREMIAIPSESCHEGLVIQHIEQEMEKLGYDEVIIDGFGNIHGRMGSGPVVISFDGHIDTVAPGNLENWSFDPYVGHEDDTYIYGRGASDQEGGFATALYSGHVMKQFGLLEGVTLWVSGTIQEEDCDGLCWQYIIDQKIIQPEIVVLTEPTGLRIHRGQRGRMEIKVHVNGVSAHGSAPERGSNAIYKMAKILSEVEALSYDLGHDDFLGRGSLAVSEIFFTSPSRCAVADSCTISIDRRLTLGETAKGALEEIRSLPFVAALGAEVSMYHYDKPSYRGTIKAVPCYFPPWLLDEQAPLLKALQDAYQHYFQEKPIIDKWTFSTNGVATMGHYGIPSIGFGPGREEEAHAPNEKIKKEELVKALGLYTLFPQKYREATKK